MRKLMAMLAGTLGTAAVAGAGILIFFGISYRGEMEAVAADFAEAIGGVRGSSGGLGTQLHDAVEQLPLVAEALSNGATGLTQAVTVLQQVQVAASATSIAIRTMAGDMELLQRQLGSMLGQSGRDLSETAEQLRNAATASEQAVATVPPLLETLIMTAGLARQLSDSMSQIHAELGPATASLTVGSESGLRTLQNLAESGKLVAWTRIAIFVIASLLGFMGLCMLAVTYTLARPAAF